MPDRFRSLAHARGGRAGVEPPARHLVHPRRRGARAVARGRPAFCPRRALARTHALPRILPRRQRPGLRRSTSDWLDGPHRPLPRRPRAPQRRSALKNRRLRMRSILIVILSLEWLDVEVRRAFESIVLPRG